MARILERGAVEPHETPVAVQADQQRSHQLPAHAGIVDPHGDLSEIILDFIPNRRVNDVVYLEPFDTARPFHLNVLEKIKILERTKRNLSYGVNADFSNDYY